MVNTDQGFLLKPPATDHTQYSENYTCEAEIFVHWFSLKIVFALFVQKEDQNEVTTSERSEGTRKKEKHFHIFLKKATILIKSSKQLYQDKWK